MLILAHIKHTHQSTTLLSLFLPIYYEDKVAKSKTLQMKGIVVEHASHLDDRRGHFKAALSKCFLLTVESQQKLVMKSKD